ncbi:MAG: cobalamin biosynthesis protein CobD [Rhizobiales bacterium]|nr:cobalamin biosynthesis protein CobD [Hyphomicrobiales bacterium]
MWPFPVFASAALALIAERFIGYPKRVHEAIGHPVEWMGKLISKLDATLNNPQAPTLENRLRGLAALAVLLAAAFVPSWLIAKLLSQSSLGWIVESLIATAFIAYRSLREHMEAVHRGLGQSIEEGRRAVSLIVGRDPGQLDESGVTRAALESLGENSSDGIVAPVLWYAIFGLPGIVLYKAINTADSMIGHRSERYRDFGWAAAKLDDLVNLPASRLSGLLYAAAGAWESKEHGKAALAAMWRDGPKHVSPNAGWPEAALAAGLGLKLGGPRSYGGRRVELPWMGDGRDNLNRHDITAGLRLYAHAMTLLLLLAVACVVVS